MRISGSRKTSSEGKGRLRLSLKLGGISGRTDTIITGPEETLLGNLVSIVFRELVHQDLEKIKNKSYFK